MPLTTVGINFIAQAVSNFSTPAVFDSGKTYIGIGDNTTAFSTNQSTLQAVTNVIKIAQDSGYPTIMSGNVLTYQATAVASAANYAWQEWGVFNSSTSGYGVMLNRKVESNGTKNSGQTWVFQTQLTFSIGS